MNKEQEELIKAAIESAKTAIKQAKESLGLTDPVERHEVLRSAHSNITDAAVNLWRCTTNPNTR